MTGSTIDAEREMPVTTALLERDEELATIASLLDGALAGDGGLLAIEGEAGAGKTSLLEAAGGFGDERGMLVLRARGGEYERDFPYGVVRQLFERLLAEDGRRAELLSGSATLAAPVFEPALAPSEGGDPFAVEHGLYWLTADLAASQPLLLLVDDAQWGDRASLRALAYVARRLDGLPVAIVLTVRLGDPGEPPELDELRGEPCAGLMEPPPLSADAVAALVGGETGRDPNERFARACCEATAGNPFLLTELVRALGADGAGAEEPDAEHLAALAATTGVSRSLLTRLGRLGEHSTEIARAVAVLEPNADSRLVAVLASLPLEEVTGEAERLIEARLLTDSRPLAFVHPLVRAAVLADLSAPQRAAAHRRAAGLLHEDGAAADAIAAHLLLAEPAADQWAAAELRKAASAAIARGAPEAAVRYLRRALCEPPAVEDRLVVSHELGSALLKANDPEGIDVLHTVRSSLTDPMTRGRIAAELASSLTLRRRGDEAIALLEEALDEVPDDEEEFELFLRGNLHVQIFWGASRQPDALPNTADDLDLSLQGNRICLQMRAGLLALGLGEIGRAREIAEQMIVDRAALEADALAGLAPQGLLITLVLDDRRDLADGMFEVVMDAVRRRGAMPGIGGNYGTRAYCSYVDGELREAQADAEIAVQIVSRLDMPVPISNWLGAWVRCLTARGDYPAAEALLVDVWGEREVVPGFPGALLLCARGELRLATGRAAEARHDYLAAAERVRWLPLANPEVLDWRIGIALCEAVQGNHDEARRLAGEAVERAREAGGARGIGVTLRVEGGIVGGAEGIDLLRQATALLAGTNARLQHAQALVDLGAALRRANRRKDAREPLREGLDLAHRCGAVPLEERARTELVATGARPRKAVFTGVESLTPSELRVARMAAEGMTNREIAQALTVTAKTVETHLRHVYQKLDVARRTELVDVLGLG